MGNTETRYEYKKLISTSRSSLRRLRLKANMWRTSWIGLLLCRWWRRTSRRVIQREILRAIAALAATMFRKNMKLAENSWWLYSPRFRILVQIWGERETESRYFNCICYEVTYPIIKTKNIHQVVGQSMPTFKEHDLALKPRKPSSQSMLYSSQTISAQYRPCSTYHLRRLPLISVKRKSTRVWVYVQ